MTKLISLARVAVLAALAACGHAQPTVNHPAAVAPAPAPASATRDADHGKIDRSGTCEQQLARLQDAYDRNAEAVEFLNQVYAQQQEQRAARERAQPAEDAVFAVDVTGDIQAGQVDGPSSAPVTIVKAFDFACPYCQRMAPVLTALVKDYGGKVRVVYANMLIHPPAKLAHLASCAAAKQGKYKEFKDAFWDKGFGPYAASGGKSTASLEEANILAIAKGVGLNSARLKTDMASPECEKRIDADMAELAKFHVDATPTFFVNGKYIAGAVDKDELKRIVDEQLKLVEQSGVPGAEYYQKVVLGKGEKQFRSKVDPKP